MQEAPRPAENANHWRPTAVGRIGMLQWKIRLIVLAGTLALIATALGGLGGGIDPIHYGW